MRLSVNNEFHITKIQLMTSCNLNQDSMHRLLLWGGHIRKILLAAIATKLGGSYQ